MTPINSHLSHPLSKSFKWGFAETKGVALPSFKSSLNQIKTSQWLIAFAVSSVIAFLAGVIIATGGVILPAILALGILSAGVAGLSISALAVKKYFQYRSLCQEVGMVDTSKAEHMDFWKENEFGKTEMIPTQHCADTQTWRKKLIMAAEDNIVLSGNYCGGKAFDEILDLIEEQMQKKPNLKVVIISSPRFIQDKIIRKRDSKGNLIRIHVNNKTRLKLLKESFPDRFSLVTSPDVYMLGSTMKKTTNHTKYLGIDWGKYFILGGSAVKDNFNLSGVDNLFSLINIRGFSELNSQLSTIGKDFRDFMTVEQRLLEQSKHQQSTDSFKNTIINLCVQFREQSVEIDSTSNSLGNEENSFYETLSSLIEKTQKGIDQFQQFFGSLESIPEESNELIELYAQTKRIFSNLIQFNQALKSLYSLIEAISEKKDYEIALRRFLIHACECIQKKDVQKLGLNSSMEIQILYKKELKTKGLLVLEKFFREASLFAHSIESIGSFDTSGFADDGILGRLIPGNFRDMDFVFHNPKGERSPGRKLFVQMLMLAYRWEQYNAEREGNTSIPRYAPTEVPHFPIFIPDRVVHRHEELNVPAIEPLPIREGDTPVIRIMKEPMKHWRRVKTKVPAFHDNPKVAKKGKMKLFFSGPEQPNQSSEFRAEALKQIQAAKKEIVIDHMYFHPTQDLFDALVEAGRRGVKIKIITCGVHPKAPNSQRAFGPRNKYNYAELIRKIPEGQRENVEVYEYTQNKKGLHKKVMIFDRKYVLAGSSNFGYKSLETTSDHEVNFLSNSPKFANEVYKVCELDMSLSKKVENPSTLSVKDRLIAAQHRILAPLVG